MPINYRKASFLLIASGVIFIRVAQAADKDKQPATQARPSAQYTQETLRDPFEPYLEKEDTGPKETKKEAAAAALPELKVQGIIWGSNMPLAIINNKVIKKDDLIEGARIVSIDKDGVTVFFANRQYVISAPAGGSTKLRKEGKKETESMKYPRQTPPPPGRSPAGPAPMAEVDSQDQEADK